MTTEAAETQDNGYDRHNSTLKYQACYHVVGNSVLYARLGGEF